MRRSLRNGLSWIVGVALALGLAGGWAHAQPICTPPSTPCQQCPSPPPCVPSNTPCSALGPGTNTTFTTSTVSCSGSFAQNTVTAETVTGPAHICIGPQKSVGCLVPAGTDNINANTDSIFASAVAIPTLSLWGLGALAVALGAWALRKLAASPG